MWRIMQVKVYVIHWGWRPHPARSASWWTDWPTDWHADRLTDPLTDILTDWHPYMLIDWQVEWLTCGLDMWTDWLTYWLACWWTDWRTQWLFDWLTDWLTYWPTDWLTNWLTIWPTDWLFNWLTHWLTDWLADWHTYMLSDWLTDMQNYRWSFWDSRGQISWLLLKLQANFLTIWVLPVLLHCFLTDWWWKRCGWLFDYLFRLTIMTESIQGKGVIMD